MKTITYQDKKKFEAILISVQEYLKEQGYNTFHVNYESLTEMVHSAKYLNRINNSLLKDEDFVSTVRSYQTKDLKINDLVWLNLKARKENTVKKLFIYEVLKNQYATKDIYLHFKSVE